MSSASFNGAVSHATQMDGCSTCSALACLPACLLPATSCGADPSLFRMQNVLIVLKSEKYTKAQTLHIAHLDAVTYSRCLSISLCMSGYSSPHLAVSACIALLTRKGSSLNDVLIWNSKPGRSFRPFLDIRTAKGGLSQCGK